MWKLKRCLCANYTFISLICPFAIIQYNVLGQGAVGYISAGYSGAYINLPGLNYSLEKNEFSNSPGLDNPFTTLNYINGISFGLGSGNEMGILDYSFQAGWASSNASGVDWNGNAINRAVQVKTFSGSFSYNWLLFESNITGSLGFRWDVGTFGVFNKEWGAEVEPEEYEKIKTYINTHLGPNLICIVRFGQAGILLNPFYCFALNNTNTTAVDEVLNLTNYNGEKSELYNNWTHTAGIQFKFLFFVDSRQGF